MSQSSRNTVETSDREILYSFWDTIPKASFFDIEKQVLQTHPARTEILRILKHGVVDNSEGRRRHALNAQEIRNLLKKVDITVSATNVYFHLKTLESYKLIHIVSTLLEKRHKIAYYGRSAQHLFIREAESRLQRYVDLTNEFTKFAKALNLDFDYQKLDAIPHEYHKLKRKREEILGQWIVRNEEVIEKKNLDLNRIFDFLKLLDSINPEYTSLFREYSEFLNTLQNRLVESHGVGDNQ